LSHCGEREEHRYVSRSSGHSCLIFSSFMCLSHDTLLKVSTKRLKWHFLSKKETVLVCEKENEEIFKVQVKYNDILFLSRAGFP